MKKITALFLLTLLLFLAGCSAGDGSRQPSVTAKDRTGQASAGVWLSFSEINAMLREPEAFPQRIDELTERCRSLQIGHVYVHVRSHCDSLFPSDYFPLLQEAAGFSYDIFGLMIEKCHQSGLKVHAWINPYRVSTASEDIAALNPASPAYQWRNDASAENDGNVICYQGIYLNPSSAEVRQLVLNGVREILQKYPVDGIHLDDYFYPTTDPVFDSASYEAYQKTTAHPLSLSDWRRSNVDALISGCHTAVQHAGDDLVFSVSPMASADKNYNNLYADVKGWVKNGYLDCIIPQLYFGFAYPTAEFRFDNLLTQWKEIAALNDEVELWIGLSPYKIGTDAEEDREEWQSQTDILARQAELIRKDARAAGLVLFSYTSLFGEDALHTAQRENLKAILSPEN